MDAKRIKLDRRHGLPDLVDRQVSVSTNDRLGNETAQRAFSGKPKLKRVSGQE